jgi:hypothetical protein
VRLTVLDSFRGIFAIMIVFLHANYQGHLFYLPIVRNSYAFVDFFFILSGFVIAMTYEDRISDRRTLTSYLIRRLGRLWPLHAAIALAFIAITLAKLLAARLGLYSASMDHSLSSELAFLIENLAFVHSLRNETIYWLNFPSWSISAEFFAYLIFGFLCLNKRWMPLAAVILLLVSGAAAWDFIDLGFGHFFGNGVYHAICYFLLGYFSFHVWSAVKHAKPPVPNYLEPALIVLIVVQIWFLQEFRYLLPFLFAVSIIVFAFEAGPVSRFLKTGPFLAIGKWSYSIYMLHALVYSVAGLVISLGEKKFGLVLRQPNPLRPDESLISFGTPLLMDGLVLLQLAIVIFLASYTYRFIERPGRDLANRLAKRLDHSETARSSFV